MGFNKSFVVKNGIEVATDLLVGEASLNNVGVGTTVPSTKLDVLGSFQASGTGRISGISTAENIFNVGMEGTTLHVDPNDGQIGIHTNITTNDVTIVGHTTVTGNIHVTGITTSDHLVVTGITTVNNFEAVGLTTIADVRVNAGFVTVTQLTSTNSNVTGVSTVGGAVTMSSTGIDVNNIDVESLTGRGINIAGNINGTTYTGDGSTLSGIVTSLIGSEHIVVSNSTGQITITGLANTSKINADNLVVTGISTLGVITGADSIEASDFYGGTFYGDGSNLTGLDSGNFQGKTIVCENVFASSPGIGTFGSIVINNPAGDISATNISAGSSITASAFYGDGSNLTNTSAILSPAANTQRLVLTSITTGAMVTGATDGDLTFNASTNTLSCTNFSGDGTNLTNTGPTLSATSGTERVVFTNLTSGTMTASSTDVDVTFNATTSELLLGTDKIKLNASDGSITAAGSGTFGSYIICEDNGIFAQSTSSNHGVFVGKTGSTGVISNDWNAYITGDGSILAAGSVTASSFSGTLAGGDITAGSIPNTALTNSTISGISLGSNLATLTRGTYLTGSDYNGSTARTWAVDATSTNTASKVVARDGSGNFSAGTITGTLSGTATNATNVRVDTDSSNSSTHYVTFAEAGGGDNRRMKIDGGMTFNPSSNTLTVAQLNGNASTSTNADNAGTLDGVDSSSFLRSDADDSASGELTFNGKVNIRGSIDLSDGNNLDFGNSDDVRIYYNGSDDWMNFDFINGNGIEFRDNGTSKIILEDSGVFRPSTNNTGTVGNGSNYWSNGYFNTFNVDNTLNVRGAIDLADNDILRFGSDDDVEMFFDGSNFYTDLNAGNFYIRDGTTTRFTFTDDGSFTLGAELNMTEGVDADRYIDAALGSNSLTIRGTSSGDANHENMIQMIRNGAVKLYHNNVSILETTSTGVTVTGDVNSTSDIRQKENISIIEDSMSILNQIDGVRYDWKGTKTPSMGVIAQTVEKVLPELINENDEGVKSVKYNGLVGLLIESVKELSQEVENLKSIINK